MSAQSGQFARDLLAIAARQAGIVLSETDHLRLAGELATLLDEGRVLSSAVPASLEPQTVVVFEDGNDAA